MRAWGLMAVLLSVGLPGQRGPSFDCAQAATPVGRAICQDSTLSAADRDMADAYQALAAGLSTAAQAHLAADQMRWIRERDADCAPHLDDGSGCLERRYLRRTMNLREFREVAYPFVGTRSIYKAGRTGVDGSFTIDIRYPQFESSGRDFSVLIRRLTDAARKSADDALPKPSDLRPGSYEQGFALYRPGANAISIAADHVSTGGAHGNSGVECALVDLRSGESVGPEAVFGPDDRWLTFLTGLVRDALKGEADHEALASGTLAAQLRDRRHYCFKAGALDLVFNRYELRAPFAGGREFRVSIPYQDLRTLWRPGGPLGAEREPSAGRGVSASRSRQ